MITCQDSVVTSQNTQPFVDDTRKERGLSTSKKARPNYSSAHFQVKHQTTSKRVLVTRSKALINNAAVNGTFVLGVQASICASMTCHSSDSSIPRIITALPLPHLVLISPLHPHGTFPIFYRSTTISLFLYKFSVSHARCQTMLLRSTIDHDRKFLSPAQPPSVIPQHVSVIINRAQLT